MPLYFILARYGRLGDEWCARDPVHCTWSETVRQIATGEWADVRQVVEVDLANGRSADVTQKAMLAAGLVREGVPLELC